jgi:nucleoside-diphosphate-sugar epimerase
MAAAILVTGATGTVGRPVVAALRPGGHDVRVVSRGRAAGLGGPPARTPTDLTRTWLQYLESTYR